MHCGKDALRGLALLLVCGLVSGCAGGPARRNPVLGRPAPPPRSLPREVAQEPAPDLRIPGPTPVQTQPRNTPATPVLPAKGVPGSAQSVVPAATPEAVVPTTAPADPRAALRRLQREAAECYAGIDSYIVRMRRREVINGKDQPEELMLFKFRREPWSVHMKWIGDEARGREVIFVKGQFNNELHTRLAAGDVPFMPAGKRMSFDPNSPLVRSSSRHPITQAGIGNLIERFTLIVTALEQGDATRGTLKYHGSVQRPEYAQPCAAVEQQVPPGRDATLSQGGKRWWFFDSLTHFPSLMITYDHTGREVEYYFYDRFELNVRLDAHDFNPDRLWGK